MNHLAIASLIVSVTNLIGAFFIFLNNPLNATKTIWGLFSISVCAWSFGLFQLGISQIEATALFWARIGNLIAIFIPFLFFHFVVVLVKKQKEKCYELSFYYIFVIGFFLISLSRPDQFVTGVSEKIGMTFYTNAGPLYYIKVITYLYFVIYGLTLLAINFKDASESVKNQYKYIFLGIAIGGSGGLSSFPAAFDISIYPYGIYLIPIYSITITYAILKYNLMDIRVVIKKSVFYTFLITIITLLYFLIVLIFENILKNILGYSNFAPSFFAAIILALILTPIKNKIQSIVDKYFFKGNYTEIAQNYEQLQQEAYQKEKFKAVATLASGLAHEIKNPLATIKTFAEYLPAKKDDPEFINKFSRLVNSEVDRIDNLVHQLLDFSRTSKPTIEDINANAIINETLDLLSNNLIKHNITSTRNLSEGNWLLAADKNQLKQALLNLFINAIEAMPNGGLLKVETDVCSKKGYRDKGLKDLKKHRHPEELAEGKRRRILDSQNDKHPLPANPSNPLIFIIRIKDTGCGIPPDKLKSIWDPFMTTKDHGTGLGLSIVKGIVENHGGTITCKSQEGAGTAFTLTFPTRKVEL